ncbi:hypothetical protein Vafri_8577, partial [Volvox africanus]
STPPSPLLPLPSAPLLPSPCRVTACLPNVVPSGDACTESRLSFPAWMTSFPSTSIAVGPSTSSPSPPLPPPSPWLHRRTPASRSSVSTSLSSPGPPAALAASAPPPASSSLPSWIFRSACWPPLPVRAAA